jgi:hypothetical protein|tara:strand:- start:36 stop:266 length:231 start_codon:yes stop_codon:yes gene_type:complete
MSKYLVRHWINVDVIAEKVVDETEIDLKTNDLGKHKIPDGSFSFVMIKDSEKINRTTYEIYDESINNSSKERTSDK